MQDGIYRWYHINYDNDGNPSYNLAARIMMNNGNLKYLEDHANKASSFPEGDLKPHLQNQLMRLKDSMMTKLIPEDEISQGLHPELISEYKFEDLKPDATFTLIGEGQTRHLELWPDAVILDGIKLNDDQAELLMLKIETGKLHMESV